MHFDYCCHCGTKTILKEIGDEGEIPYCPSCEVPLWDMFTTSIICAVVNECGEIALLRQDYVSKTHYVCVAGVMKLGESAEETAKREVKEELPKDLAKKWNCPYIECSAYNGTNINEIFEYFVGQIQPEKEETYEIDFEPSESKKKQCC